MLKRIMTLKNKGLKIIFVLILTGVTYVLVNQNAFMYHEPVGKIIQAKTIKKQEVEDNYKNKDLQITQELKIKFLNQNKQRITLHNTADVSQASGQIYKKGQKVILQRISQTWQIMTLKRDALIVSLMVLFIGLLIVLTRLRASLFLLLSLGLNLVYFVIAIALNVSFTIPVILLYAMLSFVFAASSLLFVIGANRQMIFTLLTTVLTTVLTFLITFIVLDLTGNAGIHFEYLDYVTQNPSQFFFVGTMISVLGAIMDGTGDIVAGLFGLSRQNQVNHIQLKYKDYVRSGFSIGQEIIGTLTNVLFMIFMAEAFPICFLLLKNGNTWGYIATVGLNLGLLQTIISAIGIVLAVPVTAFVTSLVLVKQDKERKEDVS